MALDRQKLADEVYMGEYYPAMGGFVPPGLPGHSPDIALPYDPDQARHLLAQAGYPGGHGFPKLEISRPELATLDYLKDQLAHNLNIKVTTRKMSWTDVLDKKQTWNFFIVSWNHDYPDPDNFLRVAIRSSIPHWRNETFDSLLGKARRSLNQDERMRLYQAADKILIEEAALIPCWYFWNHMLIKPWVSIAGGSTINLYLKDVSIEPH
jgi:oligopeptide transport system substrate-binding protein